MKNIIIFGPPGTGKGTMSEKIAEEFGFRHISTGDIIRQNQKDKTKIGLLADKIVNQGGLLPDNIVNEMIKSFPVSSKNHLKWLVQIYSSLLIQVGAMRKNEQKCVELIPELKANWQD